jgi:hypothetical protein
MRSRTESPRVAYCSQLAPAEFPCRGIEGVEVTQTGKFIHWLKDGPVHRRTHVEHGFVRSVDTVQVARP